MFCIKCGEKLKDDSEFCTKCGTKINNEAKDEVKTEIVNDNLSKSSSDKKVGIIIIVSVLGSILLVVIVVFLIWFLIFKKSVNTYGDIARKVKNTIENTAEKIEKMTEEELENEETRVNENFEKIMDSAKSGVIINFYKSEGNDYLSSYSSNDIYENNYENNNYEKVGSYECYSYNCKFKNGYLDKTVIYDGDYILYDVKTKKSTRLDLNVDSSDYVSFIYYDKVIYGLSVSKYNKYAFYDLNKKKYITDFEYSGFNNYNDGSIKFNKLIAYKNIDDDNPFESNFYIYDLTSGKIIYDKSNLSVLHGNEFKNHLYYSMSKANSNTYEIYNDKLELLVEGVVKFGLTDNGNIMVTKDNKTFTIYDNKGNIIKTSKEYSDIKLIVDNYVAVIDDGSLKLLDYNEVEVTKFTWNDKMIFHELLSGYYTDTTIKVKGIYLVVEDESIPEGTKGRGKEYYYGLDNHESGLIELEYIGGYAKPVLYLYPENDTNVEVTFDNPNMLTTTYPKYINKWKVLAKSNGDLYDSTGRYYYGLYWEEFKNHDIDFKTGFYVTKENAIKFLEEKLDILGFNNREANEFIMYWLPILESNEKSLVYFELTEEREKYNKINIKPTPDSLLRVAIHVKKVDKEVNIKEQELPTFKRVGFTAVEWGGVVH